MRAVEGNEEDDEDVDKDPAWYLQPEKESLSKYDSDQSPSARKATRGEARAKTTGELAMFRVPPSQVKSRATIHRTTDRRNEERESSSGRQGQPSRSIVMAEHEEVHELPPRVSANTSHGGYKIDFKAIKCDAFTGAVPPGGYNSGSATWWRVFSSQLDCAEMFSGNEWSDEVKKRVLQVYLSDMAFSWCMDYNEQYPNASFAEMGAALVYEFRPRITPQGLTRLLMERRKESSETYREYANELIKMAEALPRGFANPENLRHALCTFIRLA